MTEEQPIYRTLRRCRHCGVALALVRSEKRINRKRLYCNDRCRQAAYRARRRAKRQPWSEEVP